MASDSDEELVFEMAKGRSLRLADAQPHRVVCLSGSLGLTRNNDEQAAVLAEGDSYQCDGRGVVMLHALTDARVCLVTPRASTRPPAGPPARISTLAALLARLRR